MVWFGLEEVVFRSAKGRKKDSSGQNRVNYHKCLQYVAKAENKTGFDGVKG